MPTCESAAQWATRTFADVRLGDIRRTRRLIHTATRIALRPEGSLPTKLDWNALRGAYRLMHRPEATPEQLAAPHFASVRREMRRRPRVLIIHDTTELDFTSHRALRGVGPVGKAGRGLLQHNSLAVTPDGQLLGLAYQQLVLRQPAPPQETPAQKRRRPRESRWWAAAFAALGQAPDGAPWVDVADRGGDIFAAMRTARQLGHHFLIRAAQNRKVRVGPPGQEAEGYLLTRARQLTPQTWSTVTIPSKGGRPARTARVALAAEGLWLRPAWPESKRQGAAPLWVWVERIWEPGPPPGQKPLEWVLLSSLPIETEEELRQRQDWYGLRWAVAEEYHKVEKTGCGEEALRFETAEAMKPMLTLLALVAVRMLQLRAAARTRPDEAARSVATAEEVEVVAARSEGRVGAPRMTVRQFVQEVARLGGFLGRRRDGLPGWRSLWRGHQRLQDVIEGVRLAMPQPHRPSCRPPPTEKRCW